MNSTTPQEYAEKLAQIGAKLQQVRQERGITLAEITQQTLIPERHLLAIEQGNLEALPELVYVQGFVRKYAQCLGLGELLAELPPIPKRPPHYSPSAKLGSLRLYLIYVTVVAGIVSVLATLLANNGDRQEELPKEPATPQPQATRAMPTPAVSPTVEQPLNLQIVMRGESWLRVTVDDEVQFEGILAEGQSLTWAGQRQIRLRVGNAAAVSVSFNGSPIAVLGAEGEVVEKVFGDPKQSFSPKGGDLWQRFLPRDRLRVIFPN